MKRLTKVTILDEENEQVELLTEDAYEVLNQLNLLEECFSYIFGEDADIEMVIFLDRANKEGIYRKYNDGEIVHHGAECIDYTDGYIYDTETGKELHISDYGKYWAYDPEDFE